MLGRLNRRVRDLQHQDAFAPVQIGKREDIPSLQEVEVRLASERRRIRGRCIIAGTVLFLAAIFSLLIPDTYTGIGWLYAPADVFHCYQVFWQVNVAPLYDPAVTGQMAFEAQRQLAALNANLMYTYVIGRLGKTFLGLICGLLLAVGGMLFQTSFRNPLAAPVTLGVSDGVSIGLVIFVLLGYTELQQATRLFYVCVYGAGFACLAVVLVASRYLAGSKRFNVFDMLLIGTVLSQLIVALTSFLTSFYMTPDMFDSFYALQQGIGYEFYLPPYIGVLTIAPLTLIPVFLLRFRLNLVSFPDEESRLLGVNPGRLRFFALGSGAAMVLASVVAVGQVAMLSLAVPFLVRYAFGSDFRKQLLGNFFLGALMLLICQDIACFINVGKASMPTGTVLNLVIIPLFVWMMALQRRSWE